MEKHQRIPYPLRMPSNLRLTLQKQADKVGRLLHTEILRRLEQSVKNEQQTALTK